MTSGVIYIIPFEKGLAAERTRRGQRVAVTEQRDIDLKRAALERLAGKGR